MNICVIGGGRNFGKDFCDRAIAEGHDVRILSHKDYKTKDNKHVFANFNDSISLITTFNKLTEDFTHIDVFLYNATTYDKLGHNYYKSTATVNYHAHLEQLNVHVIVPHLLCVEALKKMDHTSKIVFMTSGMSEFESYRLGDKKWTDIAAYAGSKAYQNFLMVAFATHNDKNVTVASFAPHFDYKNIVDYKIVVDLCYHKILNLSPDNNNKIITMKDLRVDN